MFEKPSQVADTQEMRYLAACRFNENVGPALADLMRCCHRPLEAREGVEPTSLFSRNADAGDLNDRRLRELPEAMVSIQSNYFKIFQLQQNPEINSHVDCIWCKLCTCCRCH